MRSDVVGSLLRPQSLLDAQARLRERAISPAEFKRIEDRAVDEAVAMQQDAGLDVVTDGEMRRYAFYGHLVDALEGFDKFAGWSIISEVRLHAGAARTKRLSKLTSPSNLQ